MVVRSREAEPAGNEDSDLKLIGYTSSPPLKNIHMTDETQLLAAGTNRYTLKQGSVLVHARNPMRIDAPNCSLLANPESAVIITVTKDVTRVLDLFDTSTGSVQTVVGQFTVDLRPGREVDVMNGSRIGAQGRAWSDGLARRNTQTVSVSSDVQIVKGEYSMVDALSRHPLLYALRKSTLKEDKDLTAKIMKVGATIQYVFDRTRGPYATPMGLPETASTETQKTF